MNIQIERVVIRNYRSLRDASVLLNPGFNIIVGDNETGKSTFLEAINLALTCQINRRSVRGQLHPYLFNSDVAREFCLTINAGEICAPPEIWIEIYFVPNDDIARLRGTNNSRNEDAPGVRLAIKLDDEFSDEYAEHLRAHKGRVSAVPVEYYTVEWLTFANDPVHPRRSPVRAHLIDPTTVVVERGSSRYLRDVIYGQLDPTQQAELAVAYRLLKDKFLENQNVSRLNEALAERKGGVSDKRLSFSLDTTTSGSWENAVVALLDEVPLPLVGKGEQSSLKIRLALEAFADVHVILVEEPENHQSHSRLSHLLDTLRDQSKEKQFVITTHSNFVINKLGLSDVLLFNQGRTMRLTELDPETLGYFRKLPGHDTLRLILARRAILVEGPSDELVVQRAYLQKHKRLPLGDGVEVISVGSLAFRRFIEIAACLQKDVAIVTDNDGDPLGTRERYTLYKHPTCVKLCISEDASLSTLEPQMVEANGLEAINKVLRKSFSEAKSASAWMVKNKTDAALRIFDSPEPVKFPKYIEDAVA